MQITATKVALGKTLFWEEQLSSTRTVSCGTCHINGTSGSDPRSVIGEDFSTNAGPDGVFGTGDDITGSPGVSASTSSGDYSWDASKGLEIQATGRKANSSLNAGYSDTLFWDGRATEEFRDPLTNTVIIANGAALESQALGPVVSDVEMAHAGRNWSEAATQIENATPLGLVPEMPTALEAWIDNRSYPELFEEAFGDSNVTPARIAMAIATYERVLFTDRTPFDLQNGGNNAMTAQENRGRQVFNQSNCNACHGGDRLTNDGFRYIGVRPQNDDLGRFDVTGNNGDRGRFKVPGLRNVELRAPYMHNGRFETLADVIAFYNRGGDFDAPNKAPQIQPLGLNAGQMADLEAFLRRPLTDERVTNETGPFDRPTLYSESNRVPVISGTGRSGIGGMTPTVIANEPPFAGNPSFTIAVYDARPNANAVLVISDSDPGVGATIPASGTFLRQSVQLNDSGTGSGYGSISISIPNEESLIGETFTGRWYVPDAQAANGFSVSRAFSFTVFGDGDESVTAADGTRFDFDGDSKADISVFRESAGEFWYLRSSDGQDGAFAFGSSTDAPVPADFTGDGIADFSFWRPSTGEWFVLRSDNTGFYSFPFGADGDIPAPGDFDGDGTDDAAVFRPSSGTWFILNSSDGQTQFVPFGAATDKPLVGDFDGDGTDDVSVYKPDVAQYWQLRSTHGLKAYAFGATGDTALVGDFSGDGSDDLVSWRPATGEWFILRGEDDGFFGFPFGTNGDIPAAADYDGDGTADATVFRPGDTTWYSLQSTNGAVFTPFGASTDTPLPGVYSASE